MEPTESGRPQFSAGDAQALILEIWDLKGTARELPSERDQNFHIRAEGGAEYVLKIANARERREVLELQFEAIRHLARSVPDYAWPEIRRTKSGNNIATWEQRNGTKHLVRLMPYLPGRFLSQVKPHSTGLLHSLGVFLGSMDRAFATFHHPAADRELKWNMKFAPLTIRARLHYLEAQEKRALVNHFLERFEKQTLPLFSRLRASVIHNDANDNNVLVRRPTPDSGTSDPRVTGIIDFGDIVAGFPGLELAVGTTYAIMGKTDPLAAAVPIVAGYHQVFPLTETEIGCLYDFIAMRLCLSVAISAEQRKVEPANEYLSISEKPAWLLLDRWRNVQPDFAHYVFRGACGLSPCPQTNKVVSWLREHSSESGPVVGIDFEKTPPFLFDLSVGSPQLSSWEDPEDMEELSSLLFSQMAAAKTQVGIGRYDEPRRFYTSDIFKTAGNDGPEWRTVHLGIDLHIEPGAAVLAPLDGVVTSFANNSGRLDYGPTIILEHEIGDGLEFFTLYGHLTADSLNGLVKGRLFKKGERIGRIGASGENGSWPPHLHFQLITDLLGKSGDFPGVALPSQREVWLSLSPDPNLILKIPEPIIRPQKRPRDRAEILDLRSRHLGPNLSITYRSPLKIVRGYRQYLYDENGQAYLDAVNNVPHVGHCHPRVVRAAREQMALLNTNTRYLHDYLVEYALRLKEKLPEPLGVFFFVCSGSEANDLALRLARTHTGCRDTIVIDGAYHGNLTSLIEISPYKFDGPGGQGAPPHVQKVPTPDGYRGLFRNSDPEAGAKYARYVERAVEAIRKQGRSPSALMVESLMGSAGQIVYPPGFLNNAFTYVRQAGGVCIADEVQVGFGRVGTHFWGFETQEVIPDIVTMGKPIGNGHPLAAVATTPEIAASFKTGMEYFNTFGGNPVSCAAGLAVLDVLLEENLQQNALEVGAHLKAGLESLKNRHGLIGDVRGLGLFLGVEFVVNRDTLAPATAAAAFIAERMRDKGVLVSTDGPFRNVIKIKPPLVFAKADADQLIDALDQVLSEDALLRY